MQQGSTKAASSATSHSPRRGPHVRALQKAGQSWVRLTGWRARTGGREEELDAGLPLEIDLALEEYRTVRREELVALQSQISTLRYGVTGCVVLIGVAVQQHADKYVGWAIALALVPLVVLFSAVIWMGEYERMARAGYYVASLENRINARLADGSWRALRWESWLREGGNSQSRLVGGHHRYLSIASVFIGFQVAAVALGLHLYWHQHSHDPSRKWLIPISVVVNLAILLTLFGYFRSSYERLRDFTVEQQDHTRTVRQRLRMRVRLYGIFLAVGVISAPFYSWPLGIFGVRLLNHLDWFGHLDGYFVVLPVLIWMALVPLLASRAVMRELLGGRIVADEPIDARQRDELQARGALRQLTAWERERLRQVPINDLNAPSIGRNKNVTVTTDALAEQQGFTGALAHELAHHRLHHLHPLALSYLYLWPYLYYDDEILRRADQGSQRVPFQLMHRAARLLFTVAALPGWLAWVLLRFSWRTAEYDADRFACQSGNRTALAAALSRHAQLRLERRPKRWRDRVAKGWQRVGQGRALGYLPVPNEHPTPERRLKRLRRWDWSRTQSDQTKTPASVSVRRPVRHGK
jgi:Zn-dependent protease with chaperone function